MNWIKKIVSNRMSKSNEFRKDNLERPGKGFKEGLSKLKKNQKVKIKFR